MENGTVMSTLYRFLKYGLSVALNAAVSILIIPLVITFAGPKVWSSVAVAQAVGSFAGVFVAFGWGIIGPSAVAALDSLERGQYYLDSFVSRCALFFAVVPCYTLVIFLLHAHTYGAILIPILAGIPSMMSCLGAYWFFVGESSPLRLLLLDSLPKALGVAVGALLLWVSGRIELFLVAQILGNLAQCACGLSSVLRRYDEWVLNLNLRAAYARMRGYLAPMIMGATSSAYVNVPLVALSVTTPGAVAAYAVADKLQRFVVAGLLPITQVAQGYVPAAPSRQGRVERSRKSLRWVLVGAPVFALLFGLLLPSLGRVFSGGALDMPNGVSLPLGVAVGSSVVSGVVGLACLMSLGKKTVVAVGTVAGALLGVTLAFVLGGAFGAEGVAWSVACAELTSLLIQMSALVRALRR